MCMDLNSIRISCYSVCVCVFLYTFHVLFLLALALKIKTFSHSVSGFIVYIVFIMAKQNMKSMEL